MVPIFLNLSKLQSKLGGDVDLVSHFAELSERDLPIHIFTCFDQSAIYELLDLLVV